MAERNYRPNSHRSKAKQGEKKEKNIQKVISGTAKTRNNDGKKLLNMFISEDVTNVKSYIIWDVLVPTVKKAIDDTVHMFLYGKNASKNNHISESRISYRKYYDSSKNYRDEKDSYSARMSDRFDYADIEYPTRLECEKVRNMMNDIIDTYGVVTVADMYEMAGLEKESKYTYDNYGWDNIASAECVAVRNGYILKLPKAMPINSL